MDMDFNFEKVLREKLKDEIWKYNKYYIRPSDIGSCLRLIYYQNKYPTPVEPNLQLIFEIGKLVHEYVQDTLRKSDKFERVIPELEVKGEFDGIEIKGHIDAYVKTKEGNEFIYEFKTVSTLPQYPEKSHKMQIQLYLGMIQNYYPNVKVGKLVYIQKSNFQIREFTIEYNKREFDKLVERGKIIRHILLDDYFPDPEPNWTCAFCPFKEKCKRNEM